MFGRKRLLRAQITRLEAALADAVADRNELLDSKVSGYDNFDRWLNSLLEIPGEEDPL